MLRIVSKKILKPNICLYYYIDSSESEYISQNFDLR